MSVLQFSEPPDEPARAPITRADVIRSVSPMRAFLERRATVPDLRRTRGVIKWWSTEGLVRLLILFLHTPQLAIEELRPITRGAFKIAGAWSRWCFEQDISDRMGAADTHVESNAIKLMKKRSANRKVSLILVALLVGGDWVAAVLMPEILALEALIMIIICDVAGRKAEPLEHPPAPMRVLLKEGVPLGQLRQAIIVRATERWGYNFGLAREMSYSSPRREYEMWITCAEAITEEIERDLERTVGAPYKSMRILLTEDETSNIRRIVIRDGDPLNLEELPRAPWRDTGSESFSAPRRLGVSVGELPFEVPMAGQHGVAIAGTGGGKTSWMLRGLINACVPCHNLQLYGIDLTSGPELAMWAPLLRGVAFEPAEADALLDEWLDEIARRAAILRRIATDDDPSNDHLTEWCDELAAADPYRLLPIDEFPVLAEYDGKGGLPDLLGKVKRIHRTGRKHGMSVFAFAQKMGNEDLGSTVVPSQSNIKMAGPCTPEDSVRLFGKDRRDRGFRPHEFTPGTDQSPNDAGKIYLISPNHTRPDLYRFYLPMSAREVKASVRRRLSEGYLEITAGHGAGSPAGEFAEVVNPLRAELERIFRDRDRVHTREILERLAAADPATWSDWTASDLSDALPSASPRVLHLPEGAARGYLRDDVMLALDELEAEQDQ